MPAAEVYRAAGSAGMLGPRTEDQREGEVGCAAGQGPALRLLSGNGGGSPGDTPDHAVRRNEPTGPIDPIAGGAGPPTARVTPRDDDTTMPHARRYSVCSRGPSSNPAAGLRALRWVRRFIGRGRVLRFGPTQPDPRSGSVVHGRTPHNRRGGADQPPFDPRPNPTAHGAVPVVRRTSAGTTRPHTGVLAVRVHPCARCQGAGGVRGPPPPLPTSRPCTEHRLAFAPLGYPLGSTRPKNTCGGGGRPEFGSPADAG